MAKTAVGKQNMDDNYGMAEIMKAVAHPERLAILNLLCKQKKKSLKVKDIYEQLDLKQPIVSRHLNILKNAGVVKRIRDGQKIIYCLCNDNKTIQALSKCFC